MLIFNNEWIDFVVILFFILSSSSFIVYFDLYSKKTNKLEDVKIKDKFEDKYIEKINNLDNIELSKEKLESLKNCIVFESTPMGKIIMYYNCEKELFTYYCDRKEVPYKFLDTVARKYITSFDCKSIYTFINDELENQKNKYNKIKKEKEEKEEKEKNNDNKNKVKNVFATYKNYNMKTDKPLKEEDFLIKENINKFKWGGFLKDYQFLQPYKSLCQKEEEFSFKDFKNQAKS
jgi:hypothetical protein